MSTFNISKSLYYSEFTRGKGSPFITEMAFFNIQIKVIPKTHMESSKRSVKSISERNPKLDFQNVLQSYINKTRGTW